MMSAEARAALRDDMKRVRSGMGRERRAVLSEQACAHLLRYLEAAGARAVMAYASMGDELDTWGLVAELLGRGVRVYLPRVLPGRRMAALPVHDLAALQKSRFGVMEPKLPEGDQATDVPPLDAVIVPGLAFDRAGFRLGYGAGYYDRFLPHTRGRAIGLAFDCQVRAGLPHEAWDVPVNMIVTETGVIACARG